MKRPKRNFQMYLEDMVHAMERILEYTDEMTFEEFCKDHKTFDAVIRNFEVIGEAANNTPTSLKENFPELPWDEMYLLRNKVSHEYFGIDYEIVWDVIINHLPENKLQVEQIIETL